MGETCSTHRVCYNCMHSFSRNVCGMISLAHPRVGVPGYSPTEKSEIKKDFVDTIISKVLCDLIFRLKQPLKSADDRCTGILKGV
jgi:hypothetical protein